MITVPIHTPPSSSPGSSSSSSISSSDALHLQVRPLRLPLLFFILLLLVDASPTIATTTTTTTTTITTTTAATVVEDGISTTITAYAALGDSYASGNGAGTIKWLPPPVWGIPAVCGRFPDAYPIQVANSTALPTPISKFRNIACGGATTGSLLAFQLPQVPRDVDLVTITVGGNEVDFFSILNECVHQWRPVRPGKAGEDGTTGCEQELAVSRRLIQSGGFIGDFERMVGRTVDAVAKRAGFDDSDGSNSRWTRAEAAKKVVVTNYARFFNAHTDQCDHVTFSISRPDNFLTKEIRGEFNQLITMLNDVIKAACQTHGATYLDMDSLFEGHRFCEEGVEEPSPRPETWFFNLKYDQTEQSHNLDVQHAISSKPAEDFFELTRVFHPTGSGHKAISEEIIRLATE